MTVFWCSLHVVVSLTWLVSMLHMSLCCAINGSGYEWLVISVIILFNKRWTAFIHAWHKVFVFWRQLWITWAEEALRLRLYVSSQMMSASYVSCSWSENVWMQYPKFGALAPISSVKVLCILFHSENKRSAADSMFNIRWASCFRSTIKSHEC